MRRHNYKLWKYAIFSMLMVISLMGFGYSFLSQNLSVTASAVQMSPLTWNIGFSGTNTVTPLSAASSSVTCASPTINSTSATLGSTHLSAAGDGCKYALEVANTY